MSTTGEPHSLPKGNPDNIHEAPLQILNMVNTFKMYLFYESNVFKVIYQKRAGVFDHDIKTYEGICFLLPSNVLISWSNTNKSF